MANPLHSSSIESCSLLSEFDLSSVDVEKPKVFNIKKNITKVKIAEMNVM